MKKSEIKVGHYYSTRIGGELVVVKILSISRQEIPNSIPKGAKYRDVYGVEEIRTMKRNDIYTARHFIAEVPAAGPVGEETACPKCEGIGQYFPTEEPTLVDCEMCDGTGVQKKWSRTIGKTDKDQIVEMSRTGEPGFITKNPAKADKALVDELVREVTPKKAQELLRPNGETLSQPISRPAKPTVNQPAKSTTSQSTKSGESISFPQRNPAGTVGAALKSALGDKLKKGKGTKPPHLIIEARAGTGKTTTLIEGLRRLRGSESKLTPSPQQAAVWESIALSRDEARRVGFCAFNSSIAEELKSRVPPGCEAMTIHSLGYRAVREAFAGLKAPNKYRVQDIICEILDIEIGQMRRDKPFILQSTEALVGLAKMNLTDAEDEAGWIDALGYLASYYDIDLGGTDGVDDYSEEVYALVPKVLERCKDVYRDRCVDFNDMIWLPVALNLPIARFDLLMVDESQDLNRCQQALVKRAGTRLVFCGDPKQAVYGFAGADAQSMVRLGEELRATDRGCVVLPLTVTRRCGKAIVKEAQRIVPDFEAFETNPEGKVSKAEYSDSKGSSNYWIKGQGAGPVPADKCYLSQVQDGDFVLCRVNAPLVSQCFRFLKMGRKANIQGRDIGEGLISTIKKMNAESVQDLVQKIDEWCHKEVGKEQAKRHPNEQKLIALQDRADCLICFTEGANSVYEVIGKIQTIFTDDKVSPGIKLSSIHKAKGLESNRVFILQIEGASVPHPMARTSWQKEQENNLLYVAITRAREELIYVTN